MGQRLLIVDSDRRFIKDHQVALESAFDVDFLYGTEGVIPLLEGGDFAAALICVEVSENNGYALCSAIRKNPKLTGFKVALISSKATEEDYSRHQSLKGRADVYLHKPIDPAVLVQSLNSLVPPRAVDPDNPLGDLSGADLGDEWLDSLKAELEEERPIVAPSPAPAPPVAPVPPVGATVALQIPAMIKQMAPPAASDGKVELLESRIADLEAKLQDMGELLVLKDQELEDVRRSHESVTQNLDAFELEQAQGDSNLEALQEQLRGTEEERDQLRRQIEDLQGELDRLRESEQSARQTLTTLEGVGNSSEEELSRLRASLSQLESQNQELQDELDRSRESEQSARQTLTTLEGVGNSSQEELSRLQGVVAQLESQNQELQARLDGRAGETAEKDHEIEILKADVSGLEATLRGQRRELADQYSRLGAVTQECENLKRIAEEHDAQIQELEALVDEKSREVEEKEQALVQREQLLAEKDSSLAAKDEQLAERNGLLAEKDDLLSVKDGLLTEKSEQLVQQEQLLSQKDEALAARDAQVAENARLLAERELQLSDKDRVLQDLQAQLAELCSAKESLEAEILQREQDMTNALEAHERQKLELLSGLDEREAQIQRLNSTLEGQRERIGGLEKERQELEGNLSERTARMDALTEAIGDLESAIRRASDLTRPV